MIDSNDQGGHGTTPIPSLSAYAPITDPIYCKLMASNYPADVEEPAHIQQPILLGETFVARAYLQGLFHIFVYWKVSLVGAVSLQSS
jgi:hypothetical protein